MKTWPTMAQVRDAFDAGQRAARSGMACPVLSHPWLHAVAMRGFNVQNEISDSFRRLGIVE